MIVYLTYTRIEGSWRTELHPTIQEAAVQSLRGSDLATEKIIRVHIATPEDFCALAKVRNSTSWSDIEHALDGIKCVEVEAELEVVEKVKK